MYTHTCVNSIRFFGALCVIAVMFVCAYWLFPSVIGMSEEMDLIEGNSSRDLWKISCWELVNNVCIVANVVS